MNILELFAGTASFSNAAKQHTTFTSDFDRSRIPEELCKSIIEQIEHL